MRLGLDIDGTITADPVFFGELASTVIKNSGQVHVVSSRSPEARVETVTELRESGISYSTLHFVAPHERRAVAVSAWRA